MAIGNGLFPLAYVTHTLSNIYNSANFPDQSKDLQTIGKTTSAHLWIYTVEDGERLSRCWHRKCTCPVYLTVRIRLFIRLACFRGRRSLTRYTHGGCLLWHDGSNERKTKRREDKPALYPTGCRHQIYYHLLRRQFWAQLCVKPIPHLSKTYTVPPTYGSTGGGWIKIWNVCAIVVTVCALINTTDCNWDMTSTSFTKRRRRRRRL